MNPSIRRWTVTTLGLALTCAGAWVVGSNRDAVPNNTMAGPQVSQMADANMTRKIAAQAPRTSARRPPTAPDAISAHD